MFDKKSALKCMIIFYVFGLIFIILYLIDKFVVKIGYSGTSSLLWATLAGVFLVSAVVMTIIFLRLRKQHTTSDGKSSVDEKPEFDEKEFEEWLEKFEPYTKLSAQLTKTSNRTFTKFGGLPTVPTAFSWPMYDNRPIPFLLQIDFAEVNAEGKLQDYPTSGLMYVFVDSDGVNFADVPQDGDYTYKEGKTFKILFFDNVDYLEIATKPALLETVYNQFFVTANIVKTYPDPDDCQEAFDIYCDRPVGGMDDAYDTMRWKRAGDYMIGGWAAYVQSGGFKENNQEKWMLLMQIDSADNDEKFMWGDCGVLYFDIREKDLKERNFNNVKLDMQCT